MEWRDIGFVVAVRRHGESALIAELLTREHGRHLGLVRGGQSPKARAVLQPGNEVAAAWRGRLSEHLGTISCELVRAHAARMIDDPDRLAGLAAATAMIAATLPEREPHAGCLRRVRGPCSRRSIRRRIGRRAMSNGSAACWRRWASVSI